MRASPARPGAVWQAAAILVVLMPGSPASAAGEAAPWVRHVIDDRSSGADGVRLARLANGRAALAVGWEQGGRTTLYPLPPPRGLSWPVVEVGATPDVEDALIVDLDGDGSPDVITSAEGETREVRVHWGREHNGVLSFDSRVLWRDGTRWMFAVAGQVDDRNGPDVVIGGKEAGGQVLWLEAPAQPRATGHWRAHGIAPVGWTMSLVLTDMNGDGLADVLLSDRRGARAGVRWLQNPGTTGTPWREHFIGARGREAMFLAWADLDGAGRDAVVVPHYLGEDRRLSVFRRGDEPDAWREQRLPYPRAAGRPKAAAVADIDLDGHPDIVLTTETQASHEHGIMWLGGGAAGWEARTVTGPGPGKYDLVVLYDVDGDGDLDVISTEEQLPADGGRLGTGVSWWENPLR